MIFTSFPFAEKLHTFFRAKGYKLGMVESCTGGLIAHILTSMEGSSDYLECSLVTYSNRSKSLFAGVPHSVITAYGAVSAETAAAMCSGLMEKINVDAAVSVTGIAGPGGGSIEKPVGTVYIGTVFLEKSLVQRYNFSGSRQEIQQETAGAAIKQLLGLIERN